MSENRFDSSDMGVVRSLASRFFREEGIFRLSMPLYRLQSLVRQYNMKNLRELSDRVDSDSELRLNAMLCFSSNSGEMFRDPYFFSAFRKDLKANPKKSYRVWFPFSGTGIELFSVIIVLLEEVGPGRFTVDASDINPAVPEKVRLAQMPPDLDRSYYANYKKSGGTADPDSYIEKISGTGPGTGHRFVEMIRNIPNCFIHDPINPVDKKYDMVVMRDTLGVFRLEARRVRYEKIASSVSPGGFLCVGYRESGPEALGIPGFDPVDFRYGIYKRAEN